MLVAKALPPIWLLLLIVGLSMLSEAMYTPALTEVAHDLSIKESVAEHTITIYLIGFAFGTFLWGRLSDFIGRKPALITGLLVYVIGCFTCANAPNISFLMLGRALQAVGGSAGSVLGQAIARDSFFGSGLGKVYATITSVMACFSAIGPAIGGFMVQYQTWRLIFILLLILGLVILMTIWRFLPETNVERKSHSMLTVLSALARDRKVVGLGLIVAACNGVHFGYLAEGPFYCIKRLGMSHAAYGASFMAMAASAMCGGLISRKLHNYYNAQQIILGGLVAVAMGSIAFLLLISIGIQTELNNAALIGITIGTQMIIRFGLAMAISNSLSAALANHQWCIGTASSLFGCFYYIMVSIFASILGILHDGTLYPMPCYFVVMSIFTFVVYRSMIVSEKVVA